MRAISPNPSRPKDSRRRSLDRRFFQRFASDTHGGVMAYMGIMLPVMLGITGLALDGSLWYAQKRSVQAIADTAAYSVVLEVQRSGDTNLAKTAAKADAVTYGLDEATGDTITFNIPPKYGTFANTAGYYEVIIERPATIFLAGLLVDNFDTAARAVSGGGAASNPPCLLASDPSQKDAFKVNNGTVSTTGCNIHVNSIDGSALNVAKNGTLDADPIDVAGDYVNKGTITSVPTTGAGSVQDPLADLPVPSFSGCDYNNVSYSGGTHDIHPGVYCGGISLSGDADITMQPGNYVITGSNGTTFSVSGQASVEGDGIMAYFDGNTSLSISGQGAIDLQASETESDPYAGILFFGDPMAAETTSHEVTGNGTSIFDGIMYFPTALAKINGNGNNSSNADISAVLARELRFGGNGTLNYHIAEGAVLPPTLQSKLTLVE